MESRTWMSSWDRSTNLRRLSTRPYLTSGESKILLSNLWRSLLMCRNTCLAFSISFASQKSLKFLKLCLSSLTCKLRLTTWDMNLNLSFLILLFYSVRMVWHSKKRPMTDLKMETLNFKCLGCCLYIEIYTRQSRKLWLSQRISSTRWMDFSIRSQKCSPIPSRNWFTRRFLTI